jgi:hypothetical protein
MLIAWTSSIKKIKASLSERIKVFNDFDPSNIAMDVIVEAD